MIRRMMLAIPLVLLTGCGMNFRELTREPAMSPVGSGLEPDKVPIVSVNTPAPVYRPGNSLWQDASADLYRDPRAARIGDVVTVKISIKDKATFDNKNDRSRDAKNELDVKLDLILRLRDTTRTF